MDPKLQAELNGYLNQGRVLNIGCGIKPVHGAVNCDLLELPHVDLLWDVEYPCEHVKDGSMNAVLTYHVLEHVHNLAGLINEIWRFLAPRGIWHVKVPYWSGTWALADISHVRMFSEVTMERIASDYSREDGKHIGLKHGWTIEEFILHRRPIGVINHGFSDIYELEWTMRKK